VTQITTYLKGQGYLVQADVKVQGKSGIRQNFDLLAKRDDGFTTRTIAIKLLRGSNQEIESGAIFDFSNKAFDCGINEKVIIAVADLKSETQTLAAKQRIKILSTVQLEALVSRLPKKTATVIRTSEFTDKEEMIKTLKESGYQVEENGKLKGKSGIEHTFDIIAHENGAQDHNIVIDVFNDKPNVDLDKVALFDTKAYDSGIINKIIAVQNELSVEAKQFTETQNIKIVKFALVDSKEEEVVEKTENKEAGKKNGSKAATITIKLPKDAGSISGEDLRQMPTPEALSFIPEVMARRYSIIPINVKGNTLTVAMSNPTDILALEALSAQSKKSIKAIASKSLDVREAIDFNYSGTGEIEKHLSQMSISAEATDDKLALDAAVDAPLAQALNLIIDEAAKSRASDIHIEPEIDRLRIRYRIDGTLHDTMSLPNSVQRAIISRVKILADMNIADHHRAQDGQFSYTSKGREVDIRVATSPTVNGEMAVLRLLDKSRAVRDLSELGFLPESLVTYNSLLKVPYGMILSSGPTGAGKTTTLYASINSLDTMGRNVVTIEDPAEYRFKDINQIQVNVQAGITFASGLRSILRLDPDVILVGEIRDAETANIAVQAAMTGHLMLSSIHANDAVGALFRLLDLGIEPFLISSALVGTVAQRMVRRICPYCNHMIEAPVAEQLAYEKLITV